ncbi:hypothetical protein [Bartonella sp. DGB1]|uniref:hypothetical protein n=1 Tax=Bartonella sp. DGB1 TaxID=3239807 RepID=UPI003526598A
MDIEEKSVKIIAQAVKETLLELRKDIVAGQDSIKLIDNIILSLDKSTTDTNKANYINNPSKTIN